MLKHWSKDPKEKSVAFSLMFLLSWMESGLITIIWMCQNTSLIGDCMQTIVRERWKPMFHTPKKKPRLSLKWWGYCHKTRLKCCKRNETLWPPVTRDDFSSVSESFKGSGALTPKAWRKWLCLNVPCLLRVNQKTLQKAHQIGKRKN